MARLKLGKIRSVGQHTCSVMPGSTEAGAGSLAWPVESECDTPKSDQFFDDPNGTFFIRVNFSGRSAAGGLEHLPKPTEIMLKELALRTLKKCSEPSVGTRS